MTTVLLLLGLIGCQVEPEDWPGGLFTFQLELDPEVVTGCGAHEQALAFPRDPTEVALTVKAVDARGEKVAFEGAVALRVRPGTIVSVSQDQVHPPDGFPMFPNEVYFREGATGPVTLGFKHTAGRTVIWAEDTRGNGSYATGTSPDLCFANPTVAEVQEPAVSDDSPLLRTRVLIDRGMLMVTGADARGFFVTDLPPRTDQPAMQYHSIYIYSFQAPYGVRPGDRICWMSGGVNEMLGITSLGFPAWKLHRSKEWLAERRVFDDEQAPEPESERMFFAGPCELEQIERKGEKHLPEPRLLRPGDLPSDPVRISYGLEPWESSLVAVEDLVLPTEVASCDLNGNGMVDRCYDYGGGECADFDFAEQDCETQCARNRACTEGSSWSRFGQWTGTVQADHEPRLTVVSRDGAPELNVVRGRGIHSTRIRRLRGHLKQNNASIPNWIVNVGSPADIEWACYEGPEQTRRVGECEDGGMVCTDGACGSCEGQVQPGEELPGDGLDNDCDGEIDE